MAEASSDTAGYSSDTCTRQYDGIAMIITPQQSITAKICMCCCVVVLPDCRTYIVCSVVICGGGVIGTAIAYYLAKKGVKSTVIDRSGIAAASSGRGGGFLALDWNDSSALGPLTRLSFKLHAGLEAELGVSLDYRCCTSLSCTISCD